MLKSGNNEESSRLVHYTGIVEKRKNNPCVGWVCGMVSNGRSNLLHFTQPVKNCSEQ